MPKRHVILEKVPSELREGLAALRSALQIPEEFGQPVLDAADAAARSGAREPDRLEDLTAIDFVTIDPEGARDLDQAVFIERSGTGYRVHYAIADVANWVEPGGPIDAECHRRGQTYYAPTQRTPLHPPVLSESAASLLADGRRRPAVVWQMDLDATGVPTATVARRAWVRSRRQLTYTGVQADLDAGTAPESLQLMREVGGLRERLEVARGGVSLNLPEQEVVALGDVWELRYRTPLPVEGWNAQISLLTGMCAATMMIDGGVGLLRTLPPAQPGDVKRLRRVARTLRIDWPQDMSYPDFVRSLDPSQPRGQAMMNECTVLFRGAGYQVVRPGPTANGRHEALATHYAHATAPLRRLVDRYVQECCVHLSRGEPVPQWVSEALPLLPEVMQASDRRARKYERGIIDLVEALVLRHHVGEVFEASVVDLDTDGQSGTVALAEPAIQTRVRGRRLTLGDEVRVRLGSVDLKAGRVEFSVV